MRVDCQQKFFMKLSLFRSQPIIKLSLGIFLVLLFSLGIHKNQTNQVLAQDVNATFNRAETLNLKRQIRQLEGEIRRLNRNNMRSNSLTPSPIPRNPSTNYRSVGRSDPMFERLATLLIELKEDVHNLDKRITAIEQKIDSP